MALLAKTYNLNIDKDQRTYKPNDNYFKTWSNEMAYFLGLIAGDGHVRKQNNMLILNLKKSDEHIIYSLKSALQYDGPIYTINKKDGQTQASLTVCSKEIVSDLNALGLSGDKTYDLDWIKDMPEKYVSHFTRGLFCADGCVFINEEKNNFSASIVGTYKLTENIKHFYENFIGYSCGHLNERGAVQYLEFNGKYNALQFLDWIYTDSTPGTRLERKYELYLKLKNDICAEEKTFNNSKINKEMANKIRSIYSTGATVKSISNELNVSESIIHDVVLNRSWVDTSYAPLRKKQDTILITHNNQTKSIKEWSEDTCLPYSTVDRRYREFQAGKISLDQVFHDGEKRLNLGKTQSERDIKAFELAKNLRMDYKNGLVGKTLYEKYNVPKSRAMDLIANRTCKEDNVWWKN
jgi:LAGLIDADG-like domain